MTLVVRVSCRACNRECGDYKHLMDETVIDNEKTTLAALLNYCTNLDIKANDDAVVDSCSPLPEHICNSCVEHLIQAFLFKEMVLETDRNLRSTNSSGPTDPKVATEIEAETETEAATIEVLKDSSLKSDEEMTAEILADMVVEVPEEGNFTCHH